MFVISIPSHNTEQLEQLEKASEHDTEQLKQLEEARERNTEQLERLEEAREHMRDYIPLTKDTHKNQCWARIKKTMVDQPLSSWFSLYTHVFFNDVFCSPKPLLPDNVTNLQFNKLVHAIRKEHQLLSQTYQKLRAEGSALLRLSFYSGIDNKNEDEADTTYETIIDQSEVIEKKAKPTRKQLDNLLAKYLLIEHIVLILEQHSKLTREQIKYIEEHITNNPKAFMVNMLPILSQLTNLDCNQSEALFIHEMNTIITSFLVKLGYTNEVLPELIALITTQLFTAGSISNQDNEEENVLSFKLVV